MFFEKPDTVYRISIHAPVWGATIVEIQVKMKLSISIHAPVWGATLLLYRQKTITYISIHAPVWGATIDFYAQTQARAISIHAPVWGATGVVIYSLPFIFYFNSRSRVGSDNKLAGAAR